MPEAIGLSQGEPVRLAPLITEPILVEIQEEGINLVPTASTAVTIELGAIPGPAGNNGTNGLNGLSAYQIAVANGFVGTELEWLDSLDDHHHPMSDIDGLAAALADKASIVHIHSQGDIVDLVDDLAAIDAALADRYTKTEDDALLAGKSDVGHTHDDRYYTDVEVDALLAALNTSVALKAGDLLVPGTINAAAWNTTAADRYAAYLVTYAGTAVLTLDSDAPIGARIRFKQMHASGFSFAAGAGMTLLSRDGGYTSYGLYSVSEAWRISATEWSILGDVA